MAHLVKELSHVHDIYTYDSTTKKSEIFQCTMFETYKH